jgi:alanine dehydrogenase
VTVLGPGAVGVHAIQAAINYGNPQVRRDMIAKGAAGVQVTALDYDLTGLPDILRPILSRTDILVDATQRPDPSRPVVPNEWIADLPEHAVLVDLSVDPYDCDENHPIVKGLEGIPQGNLDQYIFSPDDPAFERIPTCVDTRNRRTSVSCYSWPGIYPKECMELYGKQIQPILRMMIERGGVGEVNPNGRYFERAIGRALLSRWVRNNGDSNNGKTEDQRAQHPDHH